jgi:hypothetical protein
VLVFDEGEYVVWENLGIEELQIREGTMLLLIGR